MTVYSRNYYKRNLLRGLTRNWKLFKNDQVKVRETTRWTIKLSKEIEVLKTGKNNDKNKFLSLIRIYWHDIWSSRVISKENGRTC